MHSALRIHVQRPGLLEVFFFVISIVWELYSLVMIRIGNSMIWGANVKKCYQQKYVEFSIISIGNHAMASTIRD